MPYPTRLPGDLYVPGTLVVGSYTPPAASIGNASWNPAQPLMPQNTVAEYVKTFSQDHSALNAAERKVLHVANGGGTVLAISAGITVALTGNATVTIDFYCNGSSFLSSTFDITDSALAYQSITGGIASPGTYDQFDVFEVVVTVNVGSGGLGYGLWVQAVFQENTI